MVASPVLLTSALTALVSFHTQIDHPFVLKLLPFHFSLILMAKFPLSLLLPQWP